VRDNADCTLRDLQAEGITNQILATPLKPRVTAVRSSGNFTTAGLRVWAQYSTYLAGSEEPGQGCLIQHNLFSESGCLTTLTAGVKQLGDAVHHRFLTTIGTS